MKSFFIAFALICLTSCRPEDTSSNIYTFEVPYSGHRYKTSIEIPFADNQSIESNFVISSDFVSLKLYPALIGDNTSIEINNESDFVLYIQVEDKESSMHNTINLESGESTEVFVGNYEKFALSNDFIGVRSGSLEDVPLSFMLTVKTDSLSDRHLKIDLVWYDFDR